jgi:hypothetical protein
MRLDLQVEFVDHDGQRAFGCATDLSVGGARVETDTPASFGSAVTLHVRLPGSIDVLVWPAVVRWTSHGVMGVQFGLLGARDTYLLTAYLASDSQTPGADDVAWIG